MRRLQLDRSQPDCRELKQRSDQRKLGRTATPDRPRARCPTGVGQREAVALRVRRAEGAGPGSGYRYTAPDGETRVAVTPVGRFTIYRKATGWQRGYLGAMYYPSYFTRGYAIHGSPSVPAAPVSHGCIRIRMGAAIGFYSRHPIGTPFIVVR